MPRIINPIDEQQERYVEGVARGESGSQLARSAGIPVSQGSSPPVVSPPPVNRVEPLEVYDLGPSSANYVRQPVGGGDVEDMWREIEQAYGNLPIDQAQKAITAAVQFQSQRGFQRDLEAGVDPAQAAMKWAPGMNRATLAGIGTMIKAQQAAKQKANWVFTPGKGGAPDTYQAPGQKPMVVNKPETDFRRPMHEPGVGIFEYNPQTKTWEKSVAFPAKPERYSTKKVEIDPTTGEVTSISGDPSDPEIKKLQEDIKAKQPTSSAWPVVEWFKSKFSPTPKPPQFPLSMTSAPDNIPTNAPRVQAPPPQVQSVAPTNAPAVKRLRYDPKTKTLNAVQ